MAPRVLPHTLYDISTKACLRLINTTSYNLGKSCECEKETILLKKYLMERIPYSVYEDLCSNRSYYKYKGYPGIQFELVTHPRLMVYRKCAQDSAFTLDFWIKSLPNYKQLRVLDLKFICTDEILEVVGANCLLLEEINIVSKVDITRSPVNAYVLARNVSDSGLKHVANLKQLKTLFMDPPKNELSCKKGRHVTQDGIVTLISELPLLNELRIETCDVGATIVNSNLNVGPLSLTAINYHFATPTTIRRLIALCPSIKALSLTQTNMNDRDKILDEVGNSHLELQKLHLSYFPYTSSLTNLLRLKGQGLLDFLIFDIEGTMSTESIIEIGNYCPNIVHLNMYSYGPMFEPPLSLDTPLYTKLKYLTIGAERLCELIHFFLKHAKNLISLHIKHRNKTNVDSILCSLLKNDMLNNLEELHIDCTLIISTDMVKEIIRSCKSLRFLSLLTFKNEEIAAFIKENNYDVVIKGYY